MACHAHSTIYYTGLRLDADGFLMAFYADPTREIERRGLTVKPKVSTVHDLLQLVPNAHGIKLYEVRGKVRKTLFREEVRSEVAR